VVRGQGFRRQLPARKIYFLVGPKSLSYSSKKENLGGDSARNFWVEIYWTGPTGFRGFRDFRKKSGFWGGRVVSKPGIRDSGVSGGLPGISGIPGILVKLLCR